MISPYFTELNAEKKSLEVRREGQLQGKTLSNQNHQARELEGSFIGSDIWGRYSNSSWLNICVKLPRSILLIQRLKI